MTDPASSSHSTSSAKGTSKSILGLVIVAVLAWFATSQWHGRASAQVAVILGATISLSVFRTDLVPSVGWDISFDAEGAANPPADTLPDSESLPAQTSAAVANAPATKDSTPPSPESAALDPPPVAAPQRRVATAVTVTALSGAAILSQGDGKMTYQKKCERCGTLQSGRVTGAAPSRGSTLTSSFTCQKFRESQKLSITAQ